MARKSLCHGNCFHGHQWTQLLSMFPNSHRQVLQVLQRQICAVLAGSRILVPSLALLFESDRLRDTAPCLSLFLSYRPFSIGSPLHASPACQRGNSILLLTSASNVWWLLRAWSPTKGDANHCRGCQRRNLLVQDGGLVH